MSRRRKKVMPEGLFEAQVDRLGHDGRGIAHIDGKVTFIEGALDGEKVRFEYLFRRKQFDEGACKQVLQASPDRVQEPCQSAAICGGCSLQHISRDRQVGLKESVLQEQFRHIGGMEIPELLPALVGDGVFYRRKARLAVKYVAKKNKVLVGFREKRNSFIAEISRCEVLAQELGHKLDLLAELIMSLAGREHIPQIEIAKGDAAEVALVFRHMQPLSDGDLQRLCRFCIAHDFHLYLQPQGPDSVARVALQQNEENLPERLYYSLPEQHLRFAFHPCDFTQVNGEINRLMIRQVLELLSLQQEDVVLDLFCGLGNFSLPMAKHAASVVGIEGSSIMVERARENAALNSITNCEFYSLDLTKDLRELHKNKQSDVQGWIHKPFNKMLIDPPRSGAQELVECIDLFKGLGKLVYVSCNPATLARDSSILLKKGFKLRSAGIMDMFPHTGHVESLAVFEK